MSAAPQPGVFVALVRSLHGSHVRRERAQAALDSVRWTALTYAAAMAGLAVADPATALKIRVPMGAAFAAGAAALAWHLARRRRRDVRELLAELERRAGAPQLLLTAWEWTLGRVRSPFGPALLRRAEHAGCAGLEAGHVRALVRPTQRRRATAVALAAAVAVSLPGPANLLHRLGGELRHVVGALPAPEQPATPLSAREAALLERLARLLERQAEATGDAQARRAARELQTVASTAASTYGPGEAPAGGGASPAAPPGALPAAPIPGRPIPVPGGGLDVAQRVALLTRLARLGLISAGTADRGAELAALLDFDVPGSGAPGEPSGVGEGARDGEAARAPAEAAQPPLERPEPTPGEQSEGGHPDRGAAAAGAGRRAPPAGAAGQARPGGQGLSAALPEETGEPPGSRARPDVLPPPGNAAPTQPGRPEGDSLPGTQPGRLEGGAPEEEEQPAQRVPLRSSPLLGPGPAHVLPGGAIPSAPGSPLGSLEPSPEWQRPAGSGGAPDVEGVPLEYRSAVRRYFQALAEEE